MSESLSCPVWLDDLCERALADVRDRVAAGQGNAAAVVLTNTPELASRPDYAVQVVLEEFQARNQRGEILDPAEFTTRFPHLAAGLRTPLRVALLRSDRPAAPDPAALTEVSGPLGPHPGEAGADLSHDYERLDEPVLGGGSMGVVLRARRRDSGVVVAVKVLRPGRVTTADGRRRFAREIEVLRQLDHPGVIRVLAVGSLGGQPAYVMPLLEGGTVARRLGEYREPRRAAALMLAVARAVGAAHAAGIVHRDLKPANVLLTAEGEPVVADFGLARLLGGDGTDLTHSDHVMGTRDYMSPELVAGQAKRVGPASDVYSLGVFLHVLLTGQKPSSHPTRPPGSLPSSLTLVTGRPVRPPPAALAPPSPPPSAGQTEDDLGRLVPDLPAGLAAVVGRCLEAHPGDRYPHAGALASDLEAVLAGRRPRPLGWALRVGRVARRHREAFLGGVAALVGVAVLGLALSVVVRHAAHQGPTDLLGEAGWASPPRVVCGTATWSEAEPGVMRVAAQGVCLLELVPRGPRGRCRLEADLEDVGPRGTFVGVYAGHEARATAEGAEHSLLATGFDNRGLQPVAAGLARRGNADLRLLRVTDGAEQGLPAATARVLSPDVHKVAPDRRQRLVIQLTPSAIRGWVQQDPLVAVARGGALDRVLRGLTLDPPPRLPAEGGLGLICHDATVLVRAVRLVPVPGSP